MSDVQSAVPAALTDDQMAVVLATTDSTLPPPPDNLGIGVVVHAIDMVTHPTQPHGWRWAVHIGANWRDMSTCLNAGWQATQGDAAVIGEAAAIVGSKVAMCCTGQDWRNPTIVLNYDPTPDEAHDAPLLILG